MEYQLRNPFTLDMIADNLVQLQKLLVTPAEVIFDLSAIVDIDTAGIALLLELKQLALTHGCSLVFRNPTLAINNLSKLYKVVL